MNTDNDKQIAENIDAKVHRMFRLQSDLFHHIKHLSGSLQAVEPGDDETRDRFHQLVLQLRLDNEDTLKALISLHNSYCSALGVSALNSELTNLERLQYSLGEDSVKLELTWLHDLVDKLEATFSLTDKLLKAQERQRKLQRQLLEKLKLLFDHDPEFQAEAQYLEHELAEDARLERTQWEGETPAKSLEGIEHELTTALELSTQFQFSVEQLTEAFHAFGGLPKFGLIHDYLAGLEGPLSRFFMAYQNGLSQVEKLGHLVTVRKTHSQNLAPANEQLAKLTHRLEQSQRMQRASLMKAMNQQQHLQAITARLEHRLHQPILQSRPTVTPPQEDQLSERMQLRRTLRMFP